MNTADLVTILRDAGLEPRPDEPLRNHTFWRIGGPADVLVDVSDDDALIAVLSTGSPVTVLGAGSNLLVADAGVRGITVRLSGAFRASEVDNHGVVAGGGLPTAVLLRRLEQAGRGGLGCLAGVPGTVGGAIRMNAGTLLGEVGARVEHVDVILAGGARRRITAEELHFCYRRCELPEGAVLTRARLRLDPGSPAVEQVAVAAHLARRKATQPLDLPSCGSVFKNPPGDHAGRLVEATGLKGHRQGGARISDKHANFIVNEGGATAADVYVLLLRVRAAVHDRFGVVLEPEVHAVGDWPAGAWPLPSPGGGRP